LTVKKEEMGDMDYSELGATYTPSGDVITIIILLIFGVMIKQSLFVTTDYNFTLFKRSCRLLMVAAICNIAFYKFSQMEVEHVTMLYLSRMIYNVCLVGVSAIFILYVRNLVVTTSRYRKLILVITETIVTIASILCLITPWTHFGLYRDPERGLWIRSAYLNPVAAVYLWGVLAMIVMLIFFRKRMIRQVNVVLLTAGFFCVAIVILDNITYGSTYLAFSYLLPMICVLVMIHSKPYDLLTGAMGEEAFKGIFTNKKMIKKSRDYIAVQLAVTNERDIPKPVGRVLYLFNREYVTNSVVFNLRCGLYLGVMDHSKINEEMWERIHQWIYQELVPYCEKYNVDYKVVVFPGMNFIYETKQILNYIDLRMKKMKNKGIYYMSNGDIMELRKINYIASELKDIAEKRDLNDPRILVYAQPVKNAKTGKYNSAECLMRMSLPEMKIVFPNLFIPTAERLGVIHVLSMIILNKTCQVIKQLMEEGYSFRRMSVNFSISEFKNNDFCNNVISIIEDNGIPFEKIAMELTESTNDEDYGFLEEKIEILQQKGIRMYLDDFGTGYSNFDRILSLGMDVIKFDRSMLLMVDKNENVRFTLNHFSSAFKDMDYRILFEGVETEEQEAICMECQADYLQGFKYSKPVPWEQLREFFPKEESE